MSQLLELTARLKEAVTLINNVDPKRFPLLLSKIIKALHLKKAPFTPQEEERLQELLGFGAGELHSLLESCAYIFEQSAYYSISSVVLEQQLKKVELDESKIEAFTLVWEAERENLVARLKEKSLTPQTLDSVGWQLHLQLAQTGCTHMKTPSAVFELVVKNSSHEEEVDKQDESPQGEKFNLEFSHEELFGFFNQLEAIQAQLDSLGNVSR